jgi:hypothetical protein
MSQLGTLVKGFGFGIFLAIAIGRKIETTYDERIKEIRRIRAFYTNVFIINIGKN